MATAILALGMVLSRAGVALAKITKLGDIDISHEIVDTTAHDSPGGWQESIQGMLDAGDLSVEAFFIPSDPAQVSLLSDAQATPGTPGVAWVMAHAASGLGWSFTAYVKNLKVSNDLKGAIKLTFNLSLTGQPTLTLTNSARLTNLVLTGATLVKAFSASDSIIYATTTTVSFTATPTKATGVITINGTVVATGVASNALATPAIGAYEFAIVTADTGAAPITTLLRVVKTA